MSPRDRIHWTLALLIRLAVGITFVLASYSKILAPEIFAQSVFYYHFLPASLLHLFALVLPWMELVAGLALIVGVWRRGAALLAALMTLVFMVGLSAALARNLDISCGCFGTDGGHTVGTGLLLRDAFMFLSLILFLWLDRQRGLQSLN